MSNKITLATIQFRADAKGVNPALDAIRQSAKDAHDEMDRLQEAADKGIKKMQDANGVEFVVADRLKAATKEARSFDQAVRELVKGATALETVVKNIRLGEIEASSRAELKGAINAAEARKRSVRETDPEDLEQQRDLNKVIEESRKQLNNLDRDTLKVIETLDKGGVIAQVTLDKEIKGLKEILTLIPKGTEEWNKYNQQLTQMEAHVANIRRQEREAAVSLLGSKDFGQHTEDEIRTAITNARELLSTYKTASPEAKALADNIVRADQYLKEHGIEAARQAARQAEELKQEKDLYTIMNSRLRDLKSLSADALEETRKFWQAQRDGADAGSKEYEKAENNLKRIDNQINKRKVKALDEILGDPQHHGINEVEKAVKEMEQLRDSVQKGIPAWQHYNKMVTQGKNYLDNLVKTEAAERIAEQMRNLSQLSATGLQEVKRYWQAQVDGAARGSQAYEEAEKALNSIINLEQTRKAGQAYRVLNRPGSYGDDEVRQAIRTMEQMRDAQAHGSAEWERFNKLVQEGKKYLEDWATVDSVIKYEEKMQNLPRLSDAALQETKKFWETMVAGAEKGSSELRDYEQYLERVKQEERERNEISNSMKAQRLTDNLNNYSEEEIREAIEAGKQLVQTYKTADPAAQHLADRIAEAEQHLKRYGVEAARVALRQKESDEIMIRQFATMASEMQSGIMPSAEAVKAQHNYWKKLIDDPKTAAESLDEYRYTLAEVEKMQEAMVKIKGETALQWFNEGFDKKSSANEVKERSADLKAYRDTLMQDVDAGKIQTIDRYLQQAGTSAKKAADELMDFEKAKEIALQAGEDVYGKQSPAFLASPEDMQAATKSIEKYREELFKTIKQKRDMGLATDAEEQELKELAKYLKDLKFEQDNFNMSREKMEQLMRTPVSAASIDELKSAIKRADAELRRMEGSLGENSDEYKRFADQVRQAKNVMKEMEGQSKTSASAWEKAFSRLKTYVVMYMGFNEVWQKMTGTARDLMDLSDRMGEVRKTTGFTADEVGRLSENLKKMDVRTSLTSLMEVSASAGQLGLKTLEDVQGFTEAANKLMIALPEMGREAATEMMRVAIATGEVDKIRKQLQEGTIEGSSATAVAMEKIASTIDRLRASSASTAPEITDFVKRVGAVGAQSGITIDQVAALGSTVSSLGMRIEMSATALSRMIPAIRNNAFELAKAIGVTPDTIRNLFDTGRGMEVILMILQRIKDTGMDADSVEQMLGMAGMRDIMKDLNQQGARAGIVFSGLSQNVDVLRRQLGVAGEAYEENIAIQQEFDKMNETTAAKWERLKNAFEEGFIGNKPQRLLGGIIDGLRKIVDFMVGDSSISSAFRTILVYLGLVRMQLISLAAGALKSVGGGLRNIGIMLGFIKGEMTKLQWGNIFTALAGAVLYAYMAFKDLKSAAGKAQEALGKTKDEVARAQNQFDGYWKKLKDTSTALEQARKSHDQLSAEVDKLRSSTDKGTAATENLKKKEDELKKSEDNVTKASNDHKSAISQMNSIYGKYLGFILTETNYANLAAAAHNKVAAAIEREMLMKQKQAAISEVDSKYSADIASDYGRLSERLTKEGLDRNQASKAMADLQKFLRENVSYDAVNNQTTVSKTVTDQLKKMGLDVSNATSNEIVALWYNKYLKDTYHLSDIARRKITGVYGTNEMNKGWNKSYSPFSTNVRGGYAETYVQREQERGAVSAVYNADLTRVAGEEAKAAGTLLQKLEKEANDAKEKILDKTTSDKERNDAYINLANALEGLENRINELDPKKDAETINRLRDMAKTLSAEGISVKKLTAARHEIHSTLFDRATFDENAIIEAGNTNPWGTSEPGESTNWKEMTAEQLVNRREQMNNFVNSLQTDTDVKAVLNEDKALKKAIEAGMSSDMRTVIEWYNTERLKIQDELHARHLTNTGDWRDPKKERGAKKQFRDEMDAYLHELDAYYTERKTRIEEAGTDEGLSEAEIRNRTLANEMEWQQRRAELQKLYSRKQKEVTQEELNAIYHIISERTGDTESFVKAQIAKTNQFVDAIEKSGDKGAAIVHRWMSQVELDTERSYLKGQQALTKQMKAIEDIIDRERPFNGITKQLRESLSTMDILTGDMRKEYDELMKAGKDMRDFNERQGREELQRTSFLLGEAEQAYSTTIDRVMQQMREKGMTAWADWLSIRPEQQEALMAQLRQTYDAIQDAIKKEASQLKKQAEIMWNNILVPGGDGKTTMKQMLDRTVAQLGIDQGRVSRANSLIGAGASSERVADKLAIQQMRLQLTMQEHYYNLMKKQGRAHVDMLNQQADAAERRGNAEEATRKRLDAQHAEMALNLATAKEETELAKQREEIIARTEESQNRLYTELRSWADLLTSSLQGVMEASHAGDAEYYNERAKLNLTGNGGPGAGTYIIIDDAGTSDATAHYEYLDERQALERQHEIEIQNAQAEAWRKLMDDINMKMSEQITDWMNAALQNQSIDANTQAVIANTEALWAQLGNGDGSQSPIIDGYMRNAGGFAVDGQGQMIAPVQPVEMPSTEYDIWQQLSMEQQAADNAMTENKIRNDQKRAISEEQTDSRIANSAQSTFAKMTQAANLYGIAYQTMNNDNLSASQKFQMFALQAAGNAAIAMLTTDMAAGQAKNTVQMPGILGKLLGEMPYPAAIATFAAITALMGGLMGLAMSRVSKSKGEIAQATGSSVSAGRLATGMLTYAKGNVNELTDPASLTPGRQYNVDGADGKTYRAKYMGKGAKTHITNGPEFHLVGEAGREAIIDAKTTRLLQMNDTGIWRDIQTLYNGGSIARVALRRRRGGVSAFAEGNIGEFEDMGGDAISANGTGGMDMEQMRSALDRSSAIQEALLERLSQPIMAKFDVYGKGGLIDSYDTGKKTVGRHGERY